MKINYQQKLDTLISNITRKEQVPTLLLHSCCAPCSSYVLEYLSNHFYITVFYYNPNIYPNEEYQKRVTEQKKFISELDAKYPIQFIEGNFDTDRFYDLAKGHESDREGGERCFKCYELRLEESALIANKKCFDYFTTTLSISPHKNADKLNEIGEKLAEKYHVKYLYSDFKKKNGYKHSIELSNQFGLYRQEYCGCIFSKQEALNRTNENNAK